MPGSVRERVLVAARAQLREVASDVLASALDTLEAQAVRARSAGSPPSRQLERTREILERDRALASTAAPEPATAARASDAPAAMPELAPLPVPIAAAPALDPISVECDEPIRTRSMAKLLAAQGHTERALAIYRYLLVRNPGDAMLQAELAAIEAQFAAPGTQAAVLPAADCTPAIP
jgi:hypothetical protein